MSHRQCHLIVDCVKYTLGCVAVHWVTQLVIVVHQALHSRSQEGVTQWLPVLLNVLMHFIGELDNQSFIGQTATEEHVAVKHFPLAYANTCQGIDVILNKVMKHSVFFIFSCVQAVLCTGEVSCCNTEQRCVQYLHVRRGLE